jgi:hypothetical protein
LWSFGIFFPFRYVFTKKNLATLITGHPVCRLRSTQEALRSLQNREKSLHAKQSTHNEKKKLTIF